MKNKLYAIKIQDKKNEFWYWDFDKKDLLHETEVRPTCFGNKHDIKSAIEIHFKKDKYEVVLVSFSEEILYDEASYQENA